MTPDRFLVLAYNIDMPCCGCVRMYQYRIATHGRKDRFWVHTRNAYAASSIFEWCKVFGSNRERTHYSKLTMGQSAGWIDERLGAAISLNASEFACFVNEVRKSRDKFFGHNDYMDPRPVLPHISKLKAVALEMRSITRELVLKAIPSEKGKYWRHFNDVTNERFLEQIQIELGVLTPDMNATGHTTIAQSWQPLATSIGDFTEDFLADRNQGKF